jgi:hypothetical protein
MRSQPLSVQERMGLHDPFRAQREDEHDVQRPGREKTDNDEHQTEHLSSGLASDMSCRATSEGRSSQSRLQSSSYGVLTHANDAPALGTKCDGARMAANSRCRLLWQRVPTFVLIITAQRPTLRLFLPMRRGGRSGHDVVKDSEPLPRVSPCKRVPRTQSCDAPLSHSAPSTVDGRPRV